MPAAIPLKPAPMTITFRGLGASMGKSPSEKDGRALSLCTSSERPSGAVTVGDSRVASRDRSMSSIVLVVQEGMRHVMLP